MGAEIMKKEIIKKLNSILSEGNWEEHKEKTREDIRKMREKKLRAEDIVKDTVVEKEEEDEKTIQSDSGNKEEKDQEIDQTGEEEDLQKVIRLEDASSYEKLESELNLFKSGKSLSNEEVKEEMKKYFDKLTQNEKNALFVFVKGLNQITLMDISGKAANTPKSMSISVGSPGKLSKDKQKSDLKMKNSKEEAETGSNTPITIGTSMQEKREIIKIVESNV